MNQIREVLRLHLGMQLSSRKIQGATGVPKTTVQDYIKRCKKTDLNLSVLAAIQDDALLVKLFGEQKPSTVSSNKILPDYNYEVKGTSYFILIYYYLMTYHYVVYYMYHYQIHF